MAHQQRQDGCRRPKRIAPVHLPIKTGKIYTNPGGLEDSVAIELAEKNGWSLDVGATRSRLFTGVSKDILDTEELEVDLGAGITNKKELYVGFHTSF
jgi:hypothetical protein